MTDKLRSAETVRNEIEAVGMTGFSPDCGLEPAAVDAIITARDREVERHTVERCKWAIHEAGKRSDWVFIADAALDAILETEDDNG